MPAMRTFGVGLTLVLAAGLTTACSEGDESSEPPLGFGVDDESHLATVLGLYGMSDSQATCVARVAFELNPSTETYADGSYDITQAMLATAGEDCEVDWAEYDFTDD